jgi:transposase
MYIRETSQRLADGSRARYLQLAHKVRDPETGRPRDKVLYHFGRADQIDRAQLKRLIESLARFLEPAEQAAVRAGLEQGLGGELSVERSLAYGGSYVLDALWRRLGLDEALGELVAEREYRVDVTRVLFALVANRALAPRSKLAIERWVGRQVAIDGLEAVGVHTLYRVMDLLVEHAEAIQERVFFATASLLNLEVDLLFFDTTSTYFELETADGDEGLRRHGHSKDHRGDLPQVVIGLAVTRDGIPVRCWVMPGNTADASMVGRVQQDLAGWKLSRVVWVMDRGMAGESQRIELQRGGGQVIVGEKLRGASKKAAAALQRAGRYARVRDNLEVKEVTIEEGSETRRFVVVRNPRQAERDRALRDGLLEHLEAEIETLNERRSGAEHTKAVCALKSHPAYGRYLRELKNGELRIDRTKVRDDERFDGKYLLSTTDPSLSVEDVALGYKQLAEVERAFRTLKSTLDLRPIYHRLPERIRSHVLLCWLALVLVRLVERETGESWESIREELAQLQRVDLSAKDGAFRALTRLTDRQRKILKTLEIEPPKQLQKVQLDPLQA